LGDKILKLFDADPGWKKFDSVIRDKHSGSATLDFRNTNDQWRRKKMEKMPLPYCFAEFKFKRH
jgi:hypothetical protein